MAFLVTHSSKIVRKKVIQQLRELFCMCTDRELIAFIFVFSQMAEGTEKGLFVPTLRRVITEKQEEKEFKASKEVTQLLRIWSKMETLEGIDKE